ncbi:MAG TPA: hypothetical protein VIN10_13000 [Bacteroidales bacterium]
MNLFSKKPIDILLIGALLLAFFTCNFDKFSSNSLKFIDGDGSGLYSYLPQILLHHSVDFNEIFEVEKQQKSLDFTGHYFHEVQGVTINKFSSGTALLQLPFFLMAWLLSFIFGFPPDGYSVLFQIGVAFAAIFWAFVGMKFFIKLAKTYNIPENISFLAVLSGFFGTNLFYYTVGIPSASHVYSFAIISVFAYFTRKLFLNFEYKTLYTIAFLFGLIVLIRPVNLVVIAAIPFLAGTPDNLFFVLKKKFQAKILFINFLLFVLATSPQLLINYLQTGQLLVYGYKNEGFIFTDPAIIHFLFSYRKGWFLYTPFMLMLIPAVIFLWKKSQYQFWSFLVFIFTIVYIFASWWNWIYGDSFGMRPMIDFYSIFLLVILIFFHSLKNKILKSAVFTFVGLAIFLNLFQSYQYKKGIIHPDSMNQEAYWYVFLKTGENYESAISGQYEYYYGELAENEFFESLNTIEVTPQGWSAAQIPAKLDETENIIAEMNSEAVFSPTFHYKIPAELVGKRNLYVIFSADYYELTENSAGKTLFVADISDTSGKTVFYKSFHLKALPDEKAGEWKKAEIGFKLPEISAEFAQLKLYIWNIEGGHFYLDNLRLRFYTYEN